MVLSNGRLEAMMEDLQEQRVLKTAKVQQAPERSTCEMGTQCPEPGMVWGKPSAPKYEHTTIKEWSPLSLGNEWDLAVIRTAKDPQMELGVQRLF